MKVPDSPSMRDFGAMLIICLLILSSAGAVTARATTDPSEVVALNTILERWNKSANLHWNKTDEPCSGEAINSYIYVECNCTYNSNKTCHIVELWVDGSNVVGTIPDELQNLSYLTYLDLSRNHLTGPVPAFMGKMTRMKYLYINYNALSGPVPKELGNLQNLIELYLEQNYLTGPIPALMGNMTQMKSLFINNNALSGPVPKELGNLQNLRSLAMGTNNFNGSIPDEFGNLTNLQQLYIDSSGLSGELPETLSNLINMNILHASDNAFTGKIPDYIGTWTRLQYLQFQGNSFQGPIPSSFSNLVNLTSLLIGDIENSTSSKLDFISNLTSLRILILRNCNISDTLPTDFSKFKDLQLLDLSFNNITGEVPQSLFSLSSLEYLFLGNNSLSGSLPSQKSALLMNIDLSYNMLLGVFPSWVGENASLHLNLVANNFVIQDSNSSVLPSGLKCLQRDIPCHKGSPIYSFAIKCGGPRSLTAKDGTVYESDNVDLSAASYYVPDNTRWGVSNVGAFIDTSSYSYYQGTESDAYITTFNNYYKPESDAQFQNTLDSELFQNARMSPSSLRYYGFGLENGNYTVNLQFAEIKLQDPPPFTGKSTGRRVFDIFIQGSLKEKDFDIRKNAGGRSFVAVVRNYTVPVTNNFIEIHFFWAGKGTCCVPTSAYYGPIISAISVSPFDFTPSEPGSSKRKTGLIVGVVVAVTILGLIAVLTTLYRRPKKKMAEIDKDLLGIVDRPDVFSYAELRTATEAFNASNILGKGGYGPVYKGKLSDGRIVAVKQLAVTSRQGKREFLTEIATISAVQHKNLVKLYGCCIEGSTPLLVYEYLENGSLDKPLFGNSTLCLDWATRFEICLGVARGLAYLHEESSVRIVHRDIKASNILIDGDLNPKISDFGLAKFYDDKITHISTRVAGTVGYLAPEYAMRGHLTEKTDVFAFGVVALEIVTGRSNSDPKLKPDQIYLLEWAWSLYEQNRAIGLLDPKLASYDKDQALRLIGVSLLCTQTSPLQRPCMSRVVSILTGDLEVSKVSSRPGYITDWQQSSASISQSHSSVLDSIIQEVQQGR